MSRRHEEWLCVERGRQASGEGTHRCAELVHVFALLRLGRCLRVRDHVVQDDAGRLVERGADGIDLLEDLGVGPLLVEHIDDAVEVPVGARHARANFGAARVVRNAIGGLAHACPIPQEGSEP